MACSETEVGGAKHQQLVVLRRVGGSLRSFYSFPIPGSSRTLLAVNTELMRAPRFSIREEPWIRHRRSGGHPYVAATLDSEPSLFLFDWMKYRFSIWRRVGPWAVVVTDPAWDDDSARELTELLAKSRPEARVIDSGLDLQQGSAHPGALEPADPRGHRVRGGGRPNGHRRRGLRRRGGAVLGGCRTP